MAKVVWLNEALDQLDQIVAYIEIFDPVAAPDIANRLIAIGESLHVFPARGRLVRDTVPEMVTVRPYILQYELRGDVVTILGIRHAARDAQD